MAAISATLLSLLRQGDHLVVNEAIYGETIELIDLILVPLGVTVTYADFLSPESVQSAIRPETVMLYTEIISNPLIKVVDIDAIAAISRANDCLLVVDNTFSTPFVIKPLQHGADIVIHSLTKFFGGHSDLTAGSVTCSQALMQKIELKARLLGDAVILIRPGSVCAASGQWKCGYRARWRMRSVLRKHSAVTRVWHR